MIVPLDTANELALVPPATTIEEGRLTLELSVESETATPAVGAVPDRVKVQVVDVLEFRELGKQDKEFTTGVATREILVVSAPEPINAVIVTC